LAGFLPSFLSQISLANGAKIESAGYFSTIN
jgi:hypothetical protein